MSELAATLRQVLADNGISGNHDGLHSWRCAYPDRYGECSCEAELIGDLVAALQTEGAGARRQAATPAPDQG
jgi:hypothetical protein